MSHTVQINLKLELICALEVSRAVHFCDTLKQYVCILASLTILRKGRRIINPTTTNKAPHCIRQATNIYMIKRKRNTKCESARAHRILDDDDERDDEDNRGCVVTFTTTKKKRYTKTKSTTSKSE